MDDCGGRWLLSTYDVGGSGRGTGSSHQHTPSFEREGRPMTPTKRKIYMLQHSTPHEDGHAIKQFLTCTDFPTEMIILDYDVWKLGK